MKQCNKCGGMFGESAFYMKHGNPVGWCKECMRVDSRRRWRERAKTYDRKVRTSSNSAGSSGKVISIPPAIYRALGKPHTIRWTLQNGEVNMEVAE